MAHKWRRYVRDMTECRRCLRCRAEQTRERVTHWGRVIGYRWRPLAGRCRGTTPRDAKGN